MTLKTGGIGASIRRAFTSETRRIITSRPRADPDPAGGLEDDAQSASFTAPPAAPAPDRIFSAPLPSRYYPTGVSEGHFRPYQTSPPWDPLTYPTFNGGTGSGPMAVQIARPSDVFPGGWDDILPEGLEIDPECNPDLAALDFSSIMLRATLQTNDAIPELVSEAIGGCYLTWAGALSRRHTFKALEGVPEWPTFDDGSPLSSQIGPPQIYEKFWRPGEIPAGFAAQDVNLIDLDVGGAVHGQVQFDQPDGEGGTETVTLDTIPIPVEIELDNRIRDPRGKPGEPKLCEVFFFADQETDTWRVEIVRLF